MRIINFTVQEAQIQQEVDQEAQLLINGDLEMDFTLQDQMRDYMENLFYIMLVMVKDHFLCRKLCIKQTQQTD